METKIWWRLGDSLQRIVEQCARKVDTERLEEIELRSNECNYSSYISVEASPRGYMNGKYDTLCFDTYVAKLADEKTKEVIQQVIDTGKGYNLRFNAEKWQNNEKQIFQLDITKSSALDNFFAPTVKYSMEAEGAVSSQDLSLYKNLALNLGAIVHPQDASMFEISEKVSRPYGAKLLGLNVQWDPALACELASEKGFDVSIRSTGKRKIMGASFSRHYSTRTYVRMNSAANFLLGINMNEADRMYGLFNSIREFGAREWLVEYKMKPEPAKPVVEEPEEPKNVIKTSEMQREETIDRLDKALDEMMKK